MSREVNSMYFNSPKDAVEFVAMLNDVSLKDSSRDLSLYNDIHIYPEEGAIIVEWVQIPYSKEWGGEFKYVPEDSDVMLYRMFPDNHYEYFMTEEEYQRALEDWLKENPGYEKNEWGRWVNRAE